MKINKYSIIALLLPLLMSGCDAFLEPDKEGKLTEEEIWSNTRRTFGFLNTAYTNLPEGYNRISNAMLASACDEAVHSDVTSNIKGLNNDTWGPYFPVEDVWEKNYIGIRRVNSFLDNIDLLKLPVRPTAQGSDEALARTRERMKGEARFLRAYFYFELIKRYGGVPLELHTLTPETAKAATRASYDDCMKQILADCDSAILRLPDSYRGKLDGFDDVKELGRATVGSVDALKSRVLLYWASPLNNPNNDRDRWKAAAIAAQEVISSKVYKLMTFATNESFTDLYAVSKNFAQYHRESIFSTRYNATNSVEKSNTPPTFGGRGLTGPTQNLVDAFGMANGKTITDPTSGYDASNPYANRDPRFYQTIVHNNTSWSMNDKTRLVETFEGGSDAAGAYKTSTKTGYYLGKLLSPTAVWDGRTNNTTRTWLLIRYAEVVLNYAEAMNEYLATPSDSVFKMVESVRNRAGLNPYKLDRGMTREQMRELIRNERRIELAFEEHRFFDIRRWRLFDDVAQHDHLLKIEGIRITRTGDNYSYDRYTVENRIFSDKMYRYPIPQTEILKAPGIKQNPGW